MKKLITLTKTLLVMAMLGVGMSAWADHVSGVYETNLDTPTGTIGETDRSSLFWNVHSMEYVIEGNGVYTIEFTNYGGAAQWNSFDLVINNGTASYNNLGGTEYVVLRADNYGWGTYYDSNNFTNTFTQPNESTNDYWVDYATAMTEANVVMTISRIGTTVSMSATITPKNATYSAWTYSWSNTMAAATGNVGFEFTTDASYMTITSASYIPADIVGLPTTYTSNFTATSMAPFAQTSGTVNTVNSKNCGYLLRAIAARNGTATATAYFDSDTSTGAYDAYVLSDGEKITISFISYHGYYSYSETTKFAINNSDGTELVSYTYNPNSTNITDVSLGGTTVDDFEAFAAISYYSSSGNANGFTDGTKPYLSNTGYNTTVTITISHDGTVSINFNQLARSLDKTFSKTLSEITMDLDNITMTNAISGRDNNSDRVMGIGNLTISSSYIYNVYAVDGENKRLGTIATVSANYGEESSVAWSKYVNIDDQWYVTSETTFTQTGITAAGSKNVTYAASSVDYAFEFENLSKNKAFAATSTGSERSAGSSARFAKSGRAWTTAISSGTYTLDIYCFGENAKKPTLPLYICDIDGSNPFYIGTAPAANASSWASKQLTGIVIPEGKALCFYNTDASYNSNYLIDYFTLTRTADATVSATIGTNGYTTFSSAYPLALGSMTASTGDVTAYYAKAVDGDKVTLTSISDNVEAGEGLVLKGTAGATITIPVAASGDAIDNYLVGCPTSTELTPSDNYYVMVNSGSGVEFQSLSGTYTNNKVTIPAGKAYLNVSGTSARLSISFADNEASGISATLTNSEERIVNSGVYDLQGRRVSSQFTVHNSQLKKGLYIVNGKKVIK